LLNDIFLNEIYINHNEGNENKVKIDIQVNESSAKIADYSFLVNTGDGIVRVDSSGKVNNYIMDPNAFYGIEVFNDHFFLLQYWEEILEYDRAKNLINSTPVPDKYWGYFTALPGSKFALLNNVKDSIYFIDSAGSHLRTVSMLTESNLLNQNVTGIVVDNSLIVSENGNRKILHGTI
jgi:hypothetical protein